MTGTTRHHAGAAAEDSVARHYEARGASLAARRWRGQGGEIDLILREGATVVFVEVKASRSFAHAAERITPRQAARIMAAAQEFLDGEPAGQLTDIRFDVALVDGVGRVEIVANAFAG